MTTQKISLSKVKKNSSNPRVIKDEKYRKLVQSIKDFPEMLELRPLVLDSDMMVLGGNMRLTALRELGYKEAPCLIASELTEEQKRQFIIKDNIGYGEWDWEALGNLYQLPELEEWGLDIPDFVSLDEKKEAEEDDFEVPQEDEIQTDIKYGDLFQIGNHRLLCGDSTKVEDVERLMDGKKAGMAFTSPPYNAGKSENLSGNTHSGDNKYQGYNDNQTKDDYLKLLIDFTKNSLLFSDYLICNIQSLSGNKIAIIEYLNEFKSRFIDVAIWDKGHGAPAMASNVFTSCWEYLFIISSTEKASRAIPNADFRGDVDNIHRGKPQRNNEFSKVHAATFPLHLPEWAIQFTKKKSIILEPFLGTGSTMVAAHQLDRICYGMELEPKYCQVIIDRMKKLDPEIEVKKLNE